jgi:hypothetical protein
MLNIWKNSSNTSNNNSQKHSSSSINSYIRQNSNVVNKSKTIGQFLIGEKLGEGTFSKVCLGTHILTKEKVIYNVHNKL